ncbi:hypothetical protein F2981_28375 (plasmid) [Sinorhizobium meliloti]|nr:hypothetical protein [Sinorhizobium meliloti]
MWTCRRTGLSSAPRDGTAATPEGWWTIEAVRRQLQLSKWYICGPELRSGCDAAVRADVSRSGSCSGLYQCQWRPAGGLEAIAPAPQPNADKRHSARKVTAAIRRLPYHPRHARRFPPEIRELLSRDADETDIDGIAIASGGGDPRLSVRERLGELRVPTLLVNGLWEKQFQPTRR